MDEGIFSWGSLDQIKEAFGDNSNIQEWEISDKLENLNEHRALKGALEEALCRAIIDKTRFNFKTKKHNKYLTLPIPSENDKIIDVGDDFPILRGVFDDISGTIHGIQVTGTDKVTGKEIQVPLSWSESVQVTIAEMNGNYVAVFRPDIWISPKSERQYAKEFIYNKVSGNKRTTRKNDVLDGIISAWLDTITDSAKNNSITLTAYRDAEEAGKAEFQLITRTSYSKRV